MLFRSLVWRALYSENYHRQYVFEDNKPGRFLCIWLKKFCAIFTAIAPKVWIISISFAILQGFCTVSVSTVWYWAPGSSWILMWMIVSTYILALNVSSSEVLHRSVISYKGCSGRIPVALTGLTTKHNGLLVHTTHNKLVGGLNLNPLLNLDFQIFLICHW